MVGDNPIETRTFFRDRPETPLGRVQVAGYVKDTWRRFEEPMRLLGTYAIVYVLDGGGGFRDSLGTNLEIQAGDLIVLFPGVPHGYGPKSGGKWSELYAHFDGPAFDVWRRSGLLDPARPIHRQPRPEHWRTELEAVLLAEWDDPITGPIIQLSQFLSVLTQMLVTNIPLPENDGLPPWMQTATALLDMDLGLDLPIHRLMQETGLPYHTFCRRFAQVMGLSPVKYRFLRRMEAACSMLTYTQMTMHAIAESLNFNDEFHFSNRFQLHTGRRPSVYRRESRGGLRPPGY